MIVFPAAPNRNADVNAIYYNNVASTDICDKILASIKKDKWQEGQVGATDYDAGFKIDHDVRACMQQPLPVDRMGFPLDCIMHAICEANTLNWQFRLSGIVEDDHPWIMHYPANMSAHNDWHVDIGRRNSASRKLGFTLQLTDGDAYEGGNLEFHETNLDLSVLRQKGTLAIFPAFWLHRVSPVTKGERTVVVGWVHGPSYR